MSMKDLVNTCFIPQGSYNMQILSPKGVPSHKVTFELKDGVYGATVTTEHNTQEATCVKVNGKSISWQQMAGSRGDELFIYQMTIYPEGVMLGDCRRNDVPAEESPCSPVVGTLIED